MPIYEGYGDYRPIKDVPRDGTIVDLMDPDVGSFIMKWNPDGYNAIFSKAGSIGIWEGIGEEPFTWDESRGAGPTKWRPVREIKVM